jgi:hypothetical protein
MTCSTCQRELLADGQLIDVAVTHTQRLTHPTRTVEWTECVGCYVKAEKTAAEVKRERTDLVEPAGKRKRSDSMPFAMQLETGGKR